MRRAGGAACLLLTALLLPLIAGPAGAASDPVTGYWSRTQTGAPVPVEPPTPAPEGGSWISADPSGPVAVTAVRADADAGQVVVGLSLPVGDSVGDPAVVVCPTTETWVPQQNGRLEAAPLADCSAPVAARVEQERLLVDLPPALQAATVDLLLAPAQGAVFSLTLRRATAEAVVQAPGAATAPPLDPLPSPTAPGDVGAGSAGQVVLPPLPPASGSGEPPLLSPVLPASPAVPAPAPQAAPPAPQLAVAPTALAEPDRTGALLGAAVLAALGALAIRLAGQPAAAPRLLGGGARLRRSDRAVAVPTADTGRGVGRFRSPRVRPPVRI